VLAERKGMSVPEARQMSSQVAQQAASAGLTFDFEHVVPANTFNAHRLIHLAAAHNRQDAMKERLLRAYFTEGQNIDDVPTLLKLAGEAGLNSPETQQVLASDAYTQEVRHDEYQAQQIGVRGVPYFVFNNKYAVSGAQPSELFHEVLEKVWAEAQPATVQLSGSEGAACDIDGNC
jgi:predicted DsbA family dithiol-disulfide isomerase